MILAEVRSHDFRFEGCVDYASLYYEKRKGLRVSFFGVGLRFVGRPRSTPILYHAHYMLQLDIMYGNDMEWV